MITKESVLEAVSKELAFYRSRQLNIHYFAVLALAVVITGQQKIPVANEMAARSVYTLFFIAIAGCTYTFAMAYAERIHRLRDRRADLFDGESISNPFPRHAESKTPSPNILYTISVIALAIVGIFLTWFAE